MRKTLLTLMALICAVGFTHAQQQQQRTKTTSILEIYDVEKGTRTVVKEFDGMHIEAPNWTMDGKWLIFNSRGRLYRISPTNPGEPELINQDAYENWIIKVELADPSELDGLLDAAAYEKICE